MSDEGRPIPSDLRRAGEEYECGWARPRNAAAYRVTIRRTGEGFFEVLAAATGRTPQVVRGPFHHLEEAVRAGEHLVNTAP